jgi:hypothetical protein
MRIFVGCVIAESLHDATVLEGLKPVAARVVEMPDDPDASAWHVFWYRIGERALSDLLPVLAREMRPHWYAHFWKDDDLCVILAGRAFRARVSDRDTWQEFIAYGDSTGVERKWTENIPTQVPAWVIEAAAQEE